jgi:serine/threonine protein kinase
VLIPFSIFTIAEQQLKVKLIDFGSAVIADPAQPRPFRTEFFGTEAYAAPEVLLKKPHQDPPVEIWTLGILLSCLLTGGSPFRTMGDTLDGQFTLDAKYEGCLSFLCLDLMRRCLEPDPRLRLNIQEVKMHPWLTSDPTV